MISLLGLKALKKEYPFLSVKNELVITYIWIGY